MENLWKKEPSSDLYADVFKNVSTITSIELKPAGKKSNAAADKYRVAGNQFFKNVRLCEAIEQYNRCLRFAEPTGDQMSFAYANRATCFLRLYRYDNCLADIELAIAANYPAQLMDKLLKRKTDCMKEQRQSEETRTVKPKLSYGEDANFPGMANVLELRQNDKYGRHIAAKCDIPAGKTVLIQPIFVASTVIFDGSYCEKCQNFRCNLIPCTACTAVMFCSDECLQESRSYHDSMCGFRLTDKAPAAEMTIKSVSKIIDACGGSVDKLIAFVEDVRGHCASVPASMRELRDECQLFLQLDGGLHYKGIVNRCSRELAIIAYRAMMTTPQFRRIFSTLAQQRFLKHLVCMIAMILQKNDHSLFKILVNHTRLISLVRCMAKQHCYPNAFLSVLDRKEVCTTSRPLTKGDPLYLAYSTFPGSSSRQQIHDKYGYWCECSKCVPTPISAHFALRFRMDLLQLQELASGEPNRALMTMFRDRCEMLLNKYDCPNYYETYEQLMRLFEGSVHANENAS